MRLAEVVETTRVPRVAGLTGDRTTLVTTRPWCAPHHPISDVGLVGGENVPRPGEVWLAHHGVRFHEARPACWRHVLAVLRQSLNEDVVIIARMLLRGMLIPTRFFRRPYFLVLKSDP
jgi:magnesium chelatase family protein